MVVGVFGTYPTRTSVTSVDISGTMNKNKNITRLYAGINSRKQDYELTMNFVKDANFRFYS
jgi:hypothetical protein